MPIEIVSDIEEVHAASSYIVICNQQKAHAFVNDLLKNREKHKEKRMSILIDGSKVIPQEHFAMEIRPDEFGENTLDPDKKMYLADKAIRAGLETVILEKIIEESKKWSEFLGKDVDIHSEERAEEIIENCPSTDTEVVGSVVSSLEFAELSVKQLGLQGATIVILNFDQLTHPGFGPRYNTDLANEFMNPCNNVNTILFRSREVQGFSLPQNVALGKTV